MPNPTRYRVSTLADRWDCSTGKIRRMAAGALPALSLMGMVRIHAHAVQAYEARCQISSASCESPAEPQTPGIAAAAARAGLAGVTPHVFRHTAATWMAQDGVAIFDIAGMLGHSSTALVESTCGHHSTGYLRAAARALG